ncbi:MAG TPA: hypothetical protein VJ044_02975, partial [Candidatus Hodarchaeales archaeon]|nr:hypothetical protein [Candidatus Hodarchaeales archaeon]
AQQSCQLWWESDGRFGPDLVRRAIRFQVQAMETLSEYSASQTKEREKLIEALLSLARQAVSRIEKLIDLKSEL